MNTSPSIVNIAVALNKAQKKIGSAVKGSANPFFRSKYADLGAVMEACKEHLNNEEITILQPVYSHDTGDFVETVLIHSSGEWVSSSMKLHPTKNMQELGSAISYAKRYSLQSLVFIPSEDDDGEKAMDRGPAKEMAKSEPKTEPPKANPWRKPKPDATSVTANDLGASYG